MLKCIYQSPLFLWAFFLVFSLPALGAIPAKTVAAGKSKYVYRLTLKTNASTKDVFTALKQSGVFLTGAASEKQNSEASSYFSFYVQAESFTKAMISLKTLGSLEVQKKIDYIKGGRGLMRMTLWMAAKEPDSGGHRLIITQAIKNPPKKITPKSLKSEMELSETFWGALMSGPLVLRTTGTLEQDKKISVAMNFVRRQIPPPPLQGGWELVIEVSPQSLRRVDEIRSSLLGVEGDQISPIEVAEGFLTRSVYASKETLLGSLLKQFPDADVEVYSESRRSWPPRLRTLIKVVQPDPIIAMILLPAQNPRVMEETPASLPEEPKTAPERRALKTFFEYHLLGSLLFKTSDTIPVVDNFAQGFVENYGLKFQHIQLFNAPEDLKVTSQSGSLQFRWPLNTDSYRQTVVGSAHYRRIITDSIRADFYGFGCSYTDNLWPAIDDLFNQISFLNYPKTVEINLEYFPSSSKSEVKDIVAYALNIRAYMYVTDQWTIEGGIYSHKFQFSIPAGAGMNSKTTFFEAGLGYRF